MSHSLYTLFNARFIELMWMQSTLTTFCLFIDSALNVNYELGKQKEKEVEEIYFHKTQLSKVRYALSSSKDQ